MSIASKLEYLDGTKNYIRQCIQQKGVTVPANTTFREYGDKILEIDTEKHPDGWEGEGGGSGNLTVGTATATGQDFVLSPPESFDGFSSVNVTGDPNLRPENIAYGVTVYGITGTMDVPTNMTKIPAQYESYFEQARQQWSGDYSGLMILESDDAIAFGFILEGFNIVTYTEEKTEFTASRWVYVAYNKRTMTWKVENWETGTSNGGSFIRNIRYCDRYLYYGEKVVYPFLMGQDPELDSQKKYTFSFEIDLSEITNSAYLELNFKIGTDGDLEINYGDGSEKEIKNTGYSTGNKTGDISHTFPEKKKYVITMYGRLTYFGLYYSASAPYSLITYISRFFTPYPPTINKLYNPFNKNKYLTTLPSNIFSQVSGLLPIENLFSGMVALKTVPSGILDTFAEYATSANFLFSNCSELESVPEDLFSRFKNLKSISNLFLNCSSLNKVPSNLFKGLTKVDIATSLFNGCSSLETINGSLFDDFISVTSLASIFYDASSLAAIPDGLLKNCTKITTLDDAFYNTKIISISKNIFPVTDSSVYLGNVFHNCGALLDIPGDIFDNMSNINNITGAFMGCSLVTGKLPEFWDEGKYGDKFTKIAHKSCFNGCTKASNYSNVPTGWK